MNNASVLYDLTWRENVHVKEQWPKTLRRPVIFLFLNFAFNAKLN